MHMIKLDKIRPLANLGRSGGCVPGLQKTEGTPSYYENISGFKRDLIHSEIDLP
ncbi:MAG: hypothetical protein ACFFD2_19155 [Promethearchaeota archaeon]